jgi:hypothetical protein
MKRATSEAVREAVRRDPGRRRGLFKPDHPRAIDRYIDYFGGPTSDPCGEGLLDSLEDAHERVRSSSSA